MLSQTIQPEFRLLAHELGQFLEQQLGPEVLSHRASSSFSHRLKPDGSVVTTGDYLADRELKAWLASRCPKDLIVSEEDSSFATEIPKRCWILDPIDGTSFYLSGGEFALQLARVNGPVVEISAIYFPRSEELIFSADGHGTWLRTSGQGEVQLRVNSNSIFDPTRIALPQRYSHKISGAADIPFRQSWLSLLQGHIDARVGRTPGYAWDLMPYVGAIRGAGGAVLTIGGDELEFKRPTDEATGIFAAHPAIASDIATKLK